MKSTLLWLAARTPGEARNESSRTVFFRWLIVRIAPKSPRDVANLSPIVAEKFSFHTSAFSANSVLARNTASLSLRANPLYVLTSIVPPMLPSTISAVGTFTTFKDLTSAAGRSSKLIPPRLSPDGVVPRPLISTRLLSLPRTETEEPIPALRLICTPGIFSSTSARFSSGSLPISSALMTSMRLELCRFSSSAVSKLCLIP